ncbi:RNA polymerase sigma factor [Brevibacterium sp. UCMA 11752]|uniref:RNA polymerase sigma factor n=1 Tax=Brevibacterium sp. UCMA 11752 TaxID=2745946 RepID=UPI001F3D22BA|nr:sigma-70 family RNA polymerase sigma factor [Brevibacterium sp. UCMA 11752]
MSDVPISTPDCVHDDNWHLHLGESETAGSAGPGASATAQRPASPEALEAQRRLHELLLRATRAQVWRLRHQLPGAGTTDLEDLAQQAADDAHLAVLRRLQEFEGRSRFSTWVYKFGILQAGVAVRRQAWRHREVTLSETLPQVDPGYGPASLAEGSDLARAVRSALVSALTARQRQIMIALLIDDVPIDVLAQRLGTTRNALYKNVHGARKRLREALIASGHLEALAGRRTP